MSVFRGNGQNGGHFYSNITFPVNIYCSFVVDSANGNGLGIRSLKSNGYVRNVFMHTSATPGSGLDGYLNPNPAAGVILLQMKNNYNYYLGGSVGFVSPVSGSPVTSTTAHTAYVIVSLGTTTLAQWQAAGLPLGVVPAVGVSFVAIATGAIGGTGAVEASATAGSGITNVEVLGDAHLSDTTSIASYGGMWVLSQCFASGTLTAPADGSVAGMLLTFDGSSVTIDGL